MSIPFLGIVLANTLGALIDATGYIGESDTPQTSYGTALPCDALGPVGSTKSFSTVVPKTIQAQFAVILRVPWVMVTAAGGGVPQGTIRATLFLNGAAIATADGKARSLTGAAGTQYVDLIEIRLASQIVVPPGGVLSINCAMVITQASGVPGTTFTAALQHNPQDINAQLVAEIQGELPEIGN